MAINEYKVLIAGCGSIGKRHVECLNDIGVEKFVFFILYKRQRLSNGRRVRKLSPGFYNISILPQVPELCKENS